MSLTAWIIICVIGWVINFFIYFMAQTNNPTPNLSKLGWKEKLMFAVPFGPIIVVIVAFIISPWTDL